MVAMRFFLCTALFLSSCSSLPLETKDVDMAASFGSDSDGRFISNFGFFGMPSAKGESSWYFQGPLYPLLAAVVESLFNYDDFTDNNQYYDDDIHEGSPSSHLIPMTVSLGPTYGMTEELSLYAGIGMGFLYEYGAQTLPGTSGYVEDYGTLGEGKFNLTGGMLYQMWDYAGVQVNFDSAHQAWAFGIFLY
jgi:hypothetical protein